MNDATATMTEDDRRREAIARLETLPSIPIVLAKIIECINSRASTAQMLKDIILKDQAITARILGLANSAAFGQPKKVTDLGAAIVVVGFQGVYDAAAGASLAQRLSQDLTSRELNLYDYWMYCVACAECARKVAELGGQRDAEQAYMFGLLHDIGKLVMLRLHGPTYDDVMFTARTEGLTLHRKEKLVFGYDHAEAGGWLAEKWGLPPRMIAIIRGHHAIDDPAAECGRDLLLCHVAEYVTRTAGFGDNGDPCLPILQPRAVENLRMPPGAVETLLRSMRDRVERIKTMTAALAPEPLEE